MMNGGSNTIGVSFTKAKMAVLDGICPTELTSKQRVTFLFCLTSLFCYLSISGMGGYPGSVHFVAEGRRQTSFELPINISEKVGTRERLYLEYVEATERLDRTGTKRKKRLPDIIGIGVEKCGTGPLRWMLLQHPMIRSSEPAETHFFGSKKYQQGLEYYKSLMPEVTDNELVFEKTPSYFMASKYTPQVIKKDLPNAKLIVVLCDPVNRTFSDFVQEIRMRSLPENSKFESVIYQQIARLSSNLSRIRNDGDAATEFIHTMFRLHRNTHLLTTGLYYYHLRRWFKDYNRSDIHIVDGEELISNPGMVIEKLQEFLGIPKMIIADDFVRGDAGFYCISAPRIDRTDAGIFFNRKKETTCMSSSSKGRTRMGNWKYKPSNFAVRALRHFYAPYNQRLFKLLGKEFDWQRPPP